MYKSSKVINFLVNFNNLLENRIILAYNLTLWIFLSNFWLSFIILKCTELKKSKPGDLQKQAPRNKAKTMKFAQKAFFSGQNPPLWIFPANFCQSTIELKCTELMKRKPRDMQQLLLRNRAKTMKLVRKLQFFRPKSAIMDFFWNFFSQSKILQLSPQYEN